MQTPEGLHVRRRRFAREQEAYGTRYSQAVSHPGTDRARPCLASEIGRDRACSGWCGRERRSPTVGIPLTPAEVHVRAGTDRPGPPFVRLGVRFSQARLAGVVARGAESREPFWDPEGVWP